MPKPMPKNSLGTAELKKLARLAAVGSYIKYVDAIERKLVHFQFTRVESTYEPFNSQRVVFETVNGFTLTLVQRALILIDSPFYKEQVRFEFKAGTLNFGLERELRALMGCATEQQIMWRFDHEGTVSVASYYNDAVREYAVGIDLVRKGEFTFEQVILCLSAGALEVARALEEHVIDPAGAPRKRPLIESILHNAGRKLPTTSNRVF